MKEKPILFNTEMVRAVLDGKKTQTRRVINRLAGFGMITEFQKSDTNGYDWIFRDNRKRWNDISHERLMECCSFNVDQIWVKETWADVNTYNGPAICYSANGGIRTWHEFSKKFGPDCGAGPSMDYKAYPGYYSMWWEDLLNRDEHKEPGYRWKPSIHMPRWASRINLAVKKIRVERLQDISEEDSKAEGIQFIKRDKCNRQDFYSSAFMRLWDSINKKKHPWESNPWVWVIEFDVNV